MTRPITGMRAFTVSERREIRRKLIEKYGMVCQICRQSGANRKTARINPELTDGHPYAFSIDHIIALADGGTNTLENMWPAHMLCNRRKGSKAGHRNNSLDRRIRRALSYR